MKYMAIVGLLLVLAPTGNASAQCRGGGSGGGGSRGSAGGSAGSVASSGGTVLTSPGSWAYDQMLGQAIARQMALQAYQKRMEDQARRAEALARRQYWAAQRREQKAKSPAFNSPGIQLAISARSAGSGMSLDIVPSNR